MTAPEQDTIEEANVSRSFRLVEVTPTAANIVG